MLGENTILLFEKLQKIERLIQNLNINQKEMLNFEETCLFLNFSSSHLYKLTHRKEIPYYKPSKKIFFNRQELTEWLQRNRVCDSRELITKAEGNKIS